MKTLVFNVFGNDKASKAEQTAKVQKMSSCRGWSKITLNRVFKMSSCRGWSKITLCRI